jgi:hypothetical protein
LSLLLSLSLSLLISSALDTIHEVDSAGVSADQWVQIMKDKIDFGLTLEGAQIDNHLDRETPVDVVYAFKYDKHLDDHF